jgi:hypothetical protein
MELVSFIQQCLWLFSMHSFQKLNLCSSLLSNRIHMKCNSTPQNERMIRVAKYRSSGAALLRTNFYGLHLDWVKCNPLIEQEHLEFPPENHKNRFPWYECLHVLREWIFYAGKNSSDFTHFNCTGYKTWFRHEIQGGGSETDISVERQNNR